MTPAEREAHARKVLASACASHPLGYEPALEWRRFRVTAGLAYYKEGRIALSQALLDTPERIETTLLHEYAHLLAFARAGRKGVGHGATWKQAMRDLGQTPVVRHRYEVQRNQSRRQTIYMCARCGFLLKRRVQFKRGRIYTHVRCGGHFRFKEVIEATTEQAAT